MTSTDPSDTLSVEAPFRGEYREGLPVYEADADASERFLNALSQESHVSDPVIDKVTARKAALATQYAQTQLALQQAQQLTANLTTQLRQIEGAIAICNELLAPPSVSPESRAEETHEDTKVSG